MSIKLCILGSGSRGNSTFIGTEKTRILVDAGLSARKTAARLAEIGESVEAIDAICVTHEHIDHIGGVRVLHKKYGIPVYANGGTMDGVRASMKGVELRSCQFTTGSAFEIGDIQMEPFPLSHDAYEPVGFIFRNGGITIGLATDMGIVTHLLREKLRTCNVVVIESNHDEAMVHEAPRPWSLKQRILSNQGHLSNRASAELIAEIANEGLTHLFLAHLSSDCNSPSHARREFETVLSAAGHNHIMVRLTAADCVSDVLELE